jgi:hypothetical protein
MEDKILQIDVIENVFLNNIKTNILLLKVAKEAGTELNIFPTNITTCLKGKVKTAGKFIWKYKN